MKNAFSLALALAASLMLCPGYACPEDKECDHDACPSQEHTHKGKADEGSAGTKASESTKASDSSEQAAPDKPAAKGQAPSPEKPAEQ